MKQNFVSKFRKQAYMDNARKYRWKKKKTTSKPKKKEVIFSRTATFYIGVISLVVFTIITVFPQGVKAAVNHVNDQIKNTYTVRYEYNDLLNPVVEEPPLYDFKEVQAEVINEASETKAEYTGELDLPKVIDAKTQYILTKKNAPLLLQIWRKESSRGTNTQPKALHNWCKEQGLSNEYGYGGMQLKLCFTDFESATDRVDKWINDNSGLTDTQLLCRYNTGKATNTCNYLSL